MRLSKPETKLGFFSLLMLGINGIVGVGIFFAPSEIAGLVPGISGVWVYVATALVLAPVALVYASLGSRFAEDGGPYVWAREAFGKDVAFLVGFIAWVSAVFSTAAVVRGLSEHGALSMAFDSPRLLSLICCAVLALTSWTGLRPSAWAWSAITLLKLAPLLALCGVFLFLSGGGPVASPPNESSLSAGSFVRAMLVAVFATQGFEIVPVPAGHTRKRKSGVFWATVLALFSVAVLYFVLHRVCLTVPGLPKDKSPLVSAAAIVSGPLLAKVMWLTTTISALGIALGMFAMTPRYLAALAGARRSFKSLSEENQRAVPAKALALSAVLVTAISLWGQLQELFALSSLAVLSQYGVSACALVVLARRKSRGLECVMCRLLCLWGSPFRFWQWRQTGENW